MLWGVGISSAEHEDPVGELASGRPNLLAVDDPLVAVEHGLTTETGQIGAGVRLGVPLTPDVLAADDAREEMLLLLFSAPVKDRVANHLDREGVVASTGRGTGPLELLGQDHLFELGHAAAPELGGPRRREQAIGGELLTPVIGPLVRLVDRHCAVAGPSVGKVRAEELFDASAERLSLCGVGRVHGG